MHITVLHINYLCLHFRRIFNARTSTRLRQMKESNLVTPTWQNIGPNHMEEKISFSSCTRKTFIFFMHCKRTNPAIPCSRGQQTGVTIPLTSRCILFSVMTFPMRASTIWERVLLHQPCAIGLLSYAWYWTYSTYVSAFTAMMPHNKHIFCCLENVSLKRKSRAVRHK